MENAPTSISFGSSINRSAYDRPEMLPAASCDAKILSMTSSSFAPAIPMIRGSASRITPLNIGFEKSIRRRRFLLSRQTAGHITAASATLPRTTP